MRPQDKPLKAVGYHCQNGYNTALQEKKRR